MNKSWFNLFAGVMLTVAFGQAALARTEQKVPEPIYPVQVLLEDGKRETVYPSVAGDFVVYSQRVNNEFSVVRVSKGELNAAGHPLAAVQPHEAIRYGVAVKDGAIGYISNRMGPISAWMHQAEGDGHIAIGNISTFNGALMPANLKVSGDGNLWCFDSSLEKTRRARILNDYFDGFIQGEMIGQAWRMYNSSFWRWKQGYHATKPGTKNEFQAPALFLFNRNSSQLTMFPDAFDGALSADGKRVVFVREARGNYDLWMQNVDGHGLTQLTSNGFGDFEPAFSPDGSRIAFVSNRDSEGDVRETSIYVMDLKSGQIKRVTNALKATDGGPAWLDNKSIVFHSNRNPKKPQASSGEKWNLWKVILK
ncbi:TolB family protein [Pseudomonadota bacterium]